MRILANIDVDDLQRGIAFYTKGLGFVEQRRLFEDTAVELLAGKVLIYLHARPAGSTPFPGSSERRRYSRHWTPVHLDFVVPDLDTAVARAQTAGAEVERPIRKEGSWREAQLSDPFGNGFCLLEGWLP